MGIDRVVVGAGSSFGSFCVSCRSRWHIRATNWWLHGSQDTEGRWWGAACTLWPHPSWEVLDKSRVEVVAWRDSLEGLGTFHWQLE